MRQMTWEEIGVDPQDLIELIGGPARTLREVLRMHQMTGEEIGVDPQDVIELIGGPARTLREVLRMRQMTWEEIGVDPQEVIELLGGTEKFMQIIGEEQAMTNLARFFGKNRLKEILEQLPDEVEQATKNP